MTDNELRAAAEAVVARWDSIDWKAAPTAEVMNRLRNALSAPEKPAESQPLPESVEEWIQQHAATTLAGRVFTLYASDVHDYITTLHNQHQAELELFRSKLALVLRENRRLSDELKAGDHELVTMESTLESYPDARKAVAALIDWHCQVALDPSVSNDARALVEQGRREALQECAALCEQFEFKVSGWGIIQRAINELIESARTAQI